MTAEASQPVALLDTVQTSRHNAWYDARDEQDQEIRVRVVNALRQSEIEADWQKADRLAGCGRWTRACLDCGAIHPQPVRRFCGFDRLCPTCARIRSRRLAAEVRWDIERLMQKPVYGYRFRLITLTLRTEGEFKAAVDLAVESFRKLWRGFLGKPLRVAGVRSIEFGPVNGNVHIHLLYYGPFMPQQEISDRWAKLTGSFVVDIQEMKGDWADAVSEVCKYLTKFSEVNPERLIEIVRVNKGRRLVERYGLLREAKLQEWVGSGKPEPESEEKEIEPCPVCGSIRFTFFRVERGPPKE